MGADHQSAPFDHDDDDDDVDDTLSSHDKLAMAIMMTRMTLMENLSPAFFIFDKVCNFSLFAFNYGLLMNDVEGYDE